MQLHEGILAALQAGVRKHAGPGHDEEIAAAFKQSIPGTIAAALDACAGKRWTPPEIKSRAAKLAKVRAERAAAQARGEDPDAAADGEDTPE